jgi:MFS family permease
MEETPVFAQMQATGNIAASPVREALGTSKNWSLIWKIIFGGNAAQSTIMQTAQFVTLYFLQRAVKIEEHISLLILAAALLLGAPFFQWAGKWSDTYGRRKVIYTGICLGAVSIPVSFYLFNLYGNPEHLSAVHAISTPVMVFFIFLTFVNTLASALVYGPMGAYVMEFFSGRTRYTSMGFTHNVGNGVLGGATPLITEFLKANLIVGASFSPYIGLLYPMGLIAIALVINPFVQEPPQFRSN